MFEVILQIGSAAVLGALAIRVKVKAQQSSQGTWNQILGHFRSGHRELAKLASMNENSRGNRGKASEVWVAIGGMRGWWRMYKNTRVLIDAVDFLSNCSASERRVAERLRQARFQIGRAGIMAALILAGAVVVPFRLSILDSSLAAYVEAVHVVSGIVEEFFPNLVRTYRYFITRDSASIGG